MKIERLKHRSKKLIKSHVHWDSPNKESKKGNWAKQKVVNLLWQNTAQ